VRPGSAAGQTLIIVPAYNEAMNIAGVVHELHETAPGVPVLVLDDCSTDSTRDVASEAGADVLSMPHHLGLGGCVQAGYKLAYELGFQYVVRVDGDGQHDPEGIPRILQTLKSTSCDMVIGSRYLNGSGEPYTTITRRLGIEFFRLFLRPVLGQSVRDPTSGFVGVKRTALAVFSSSFPLEYPEIEALVVLQRKRFKFVEVPCRMRPRKAGRSTITAVKSLYYIVHVLLGVFVNVLRFEGRRRRR
jgi:glycosyltransferase involved in cell wall biosynthesis